MANFMLSIQAKADADHKRASHCTWCGREGIPYAFLGVCFDGLYNYGEERLCLACRFAGIDADGNRIPNLPEEGSQRYPNS